MITTITKNNIDNKEFLFIIDDLINNETVKKMKDFKQHYDTSTFEHCLNVAYISYKICKKLNLDYKSATRAAMLHDLFLYDWRKKNRQVELNGLHAFVHPKIALKNASTLFNLNNVEKDIIVKHMWPVTLALPKYRESYVISFADKYSAIQESFSYYNSSLTKKSFYKYAYIFLSFLIFI